MKRGIGIGVFAVAVYFFAMSAFAEVTKFELQTCEAKIAGEKIFSFNPPQLNDLDFATKKHFGSYLHFVTFFSKTDLNIFLSVQMINQPLKGQVKSGMGFAQEQKQLAEGNPKIKGETQVGPLVIDGVEGGMFRYQKQTGTAKPITHVDVAVVFDDNLFSFVYEAPSEVFAQNEPLFLESLKSVKFYPEDIQRFWHKVLVEKAPGTIELNVGTKIEGKIEK